MITVRATWRPGARRKKRNVAEGSRNFFFFGERAEVGTLEIDE